MSYIPLFSSPKPRQTSTIDHDILYHTESGLSLYMFLIKGLQDITTSWMELVHKWKSTSCTKDLPNLDIPEFSDGDFLQDCSSQSSFTHGIFLACFSISAPWPQGYLSQMALHQHNPFCDVCLPLLEKDIGNYSGHTPLPPLIMRSLGVACIINCGPLCWSFREKTEVREVGENRNPSSQAEGESSTNLISCSWSHSSAATCCQKHVFENSNRCELRQSVWISNDSC